MAGTHLMPRNTTLCAWVRQVKHRPRTGSNHPKCHIIRKIWAAGFSVIKRKIAHFSNERDAYQCEADRIREIGYDQLTNLQISGRFIGLRSPLSESAPSSTIVADWSEMRFERLAKTFAYILRAMVQGDGHLYRSYWVAPNTIAQEPLPEAEAAYLELLQEAIAELGLPVVNRYLKAAGKVTVSFHGGS